MSENNVLEERFSFDSARRTYSLKDESIYLEYESRSYRDFNNQRKTHVTLSLKERKTNHHGFTRGRLHADIVNHNGEIEILDSIVNTIDRSLFWARYYTPKKIEGDENDLHLPVVRKLFAELEERCKKAVLPSKKVKE